MSALGPGVHSVHIYNEQSALISRLCGIVSSSLRVGEAVLIVATADVRDGLVEALRESDFDLPAHAREGRFTMVDARQALSTFMLDGMPDRDRFAASVGQMLSELRERARNRARSLMVFGEMVAVLWAEGQKQAALQLEKLWNEALCDNGFHLHCAYPRAALLNDADLADVCSSHSHILRDPFQRGDLALDPQLAA